MSLSPSIRLPILSAVLIFLAAVGSTQTAIFFMARDVEETTQTLGKVYLDGLTAALLPHLRAPDAAGAQRVLEQALQVQEGVVERQLVVFDQEGKVVAQVGRKPERMLEGALRAGNEHVRAGDGSERFFREVHDKGRVVGGVAASLDLRFLRQQRSTLRWWLMAFDLGLSALCAALGYVVVERAQRPISTLAQRLSEAARGVPTEIPAHEIPTSDPRAERMLHVYNSMVRAHSEREALLNHMATQEREAVLGRLAATVAHEVRNPLAGMQTALGTLRRFGDDPDTRNEAVDFLLRGVRALEGVVDATLASYRPRSSLRALSPKDFDDLRLLVEADSRTRQIRLDWDVALTHEVQVSALEVRQVVLNLLLNAVHACPEGGAVKLKACLREQELAIEVRNDRREADEGLLQAVREAETNGKGTGLGVSVVLRLVERLNGRVSVSSEPETGTLVALSIPWQSAEDNAHEAS